jgi:hypothetical protein
MTKPNGLWRHTGVRLARLQPYFPASRGKARIGARPLLSGIISIALNAMRWCDGGDGLIDIPTRDGLTMVS